MGRERVHVYRAADGWRWKLSARNGRLIAESGEAYTNRSKAADGWQRVFRACATPDGPVIVHEQT